MNRIYFFANFGDWNKQPYGGGEVGNRRTLNILKRMAFKIIVIEKYKRVPTHSFVNMIVLMARAAYNVVQFTVKLLFGYRKDALVHIVGFYGPMVYFEYILVSIAYILGYRIIYEMRGGGADLYYKDGSYFYRRIFAKLVDKTECIFSQGEENYPLLQAVSPTKQIFYYPNYVMDNFMPVACPAKPNDRINFLYFGRVSKTKNVDLVVDIFERVACRHENVFLDIVGNCSEPEYAEYIKRIITYRALDTKIKMCPACDHKELKNFLSDKHFYIFPTTEPHEGHSNALTEAMAWGLIPIASAQGFNKSVIGDERLIASEFSADCFASVIMKIIDDNLIQILSEAMYHRVKNNFTEDVVGANLRKIYEQLFSN